MHDIIQKSAVIQKNHKDRKNIFLFLLLFATSIGNAQNSEKHDSHGRITTEQIEEILPPIVKNTNWELTVPLKIMQSRTITVEVIDTASILTRIFYYSPRMENEDYPYWQELGDQNNYLGTTIDNKAKILIPDTCEQGAKLLFYAIGYEPFEVAIGSVRNQTHVSVQLTRKIYNGHVILQKVEHPHHHRQTFLKPVIVDEIESQTRIFYGVCAPIYLEDGSHLDPLCAFFSVYYYPKLWIVDIEKPILKEVYKELKKGKDCSILLYVNRSGIIYALETEEFPNKKNQYVIQQDMKNSKWRFTQDVAGNFFHYRVHFVLPKTK